MASEAIVVALPIKTKNSQNAPLTGSMVSRIIYRKEKKSQHHAAYVHVLGAMLKAKVRPRDLLPCVVTLTRLSAGRFDDDGCVGALKWVRDGVAEALGVDDGGPHIAFRYEQRRCPRGQFGIEIRIERRSEAEVRR